jgi:hypothetical protein
MMMGFRTCGGGVSVDIQACEAVLTTVPAPYCVGRDFLHVHFTHLSRHPKLLAYSNGKLLVRHHLRLQSPCFTNTPSFHFRFLIICTNIDVHDELPVRTAFWTVTIFTRVHDDVRRVRTFSIRYIIFIIAGVYIYVCLCSFMCTACDVNTIAPSNALRNSSSGCIAVSAVIQPSPNFD